jgi:hypothetical protein
MSEGDPRIKDVAIFASAEPTPKPSVAVVRVLDDKSAPTLAQSSSFLPFKVPGPDKGVKIYRGEYGGESCFYFRVPVQKKDNNDEELYSAAMLILSAEQIDTQVVRGRRCRGHRPHASKIDLRF